MLTGDTERTAKAIAVIDGKRWYKTGDKGHVDEDGFITIVDRYSRFAKLGGEMVSLGAVESRISESHILDDTDDFCAVAIPDEAKGERIAVLYSGKLTAGDLRAKLRGIGLPPLMIPSIVLPVPAIPKLGTGKTDFTTAKIVAREIIEQSAK